MNRRNDESSVVGDDPSVVEPDDNNAADHDIANSAPGPDDVYEDAPESAPVEDVPAADDNQPAIDDEVIIDLRDAQPADTEEGADGGRNRTADTAYLVDRRRPMSDIHAPDVRVAIDVSTALNSESLDLLQLLAIGLVTAFGNDEHVGLTLLDGRSGQLRPISNRQRDRILGQLEQALPPTIRRMERRLAKAGLRSRRWEPVADTWFVDLEPAWNGPIPRAELLPSLQADGVRVAAFIPDLLRLHNPSWFPTAEVTGFRQWLRAHRTAASTWLAASLVTAEDLVYWLGPRSKNHDVKLIALGASPEALAANPTLNTAADPEPDSPAGSGADPTTGPDPVALGRLLMVGPIAEHRGHRLLLEALDHLDKTQSAASGSGSSTAGEGPVIDIVGDPGPDEELNRRLETHPAVRLHAQLSDAGLEQLWAETAFFLSPCLGDGTGPMVVEALARGIPVVTTDLPALAEASQGLATALRPDPVAWANFLRDRLEHHPIAVDRSRRFRATGWDDTATELRRFLEGIERTQRSPATSRTSARLSMSGRYVT